MIFSCLTALTSFAALVATPIEPKIATYEVKNCTINSATSRSWIRTAWTFPASNSTIHLTINHDFKLDRCAIQKMYWYLDDVAAVKRLTRLERKTIERWRGDVNLSLWHFIVDQCKLAKKAGL
jgi:hypothetical protein